MLMVYVSTDYVFDGRGSEPIPEARPRPVNLRILKVAWWWQFNSDGKFFIVRTLALWEQFVKKIHGGSPMTGSTVDDRSAHRRTLVTGGICLCASDT